MFEGIGIGDFIDQFKTDSDCKNYLYELKWKDGFVCKKCGNSRWGKQEYRSYFS